MGRPHRAAVGGYVYHVLNRANARLTTFDSDGDYQAFEEILVEARAGAACFPVQVASPLVHAMPRCRTL
jgi:hypothetical protein